VPKRYEKEIASYVTRLASLPTEEYVTPQEVFAPINKKYTRPGAMLLGARTRDGLTQKKLAEKLGISQPNVAAMETGRRPIGKEMAKRLAALFKTDYRVFL
jgi:DNA-binding XRE family transcriptional regulator